MLTLTKFTICNTSLVRMIQNITHFDASKTLILYMNV